MALPDLATLSDEELADLSQMVIVEQERRTNLANIPAQIEGLRQKFIDGGGDPGDLP